MPREECGLTIPFIHSVGPKEDQAVESRGHNEDLQVILAKQQLKKRWEREYASNFQRGHKISESEIGRIRFSLSLVGRMFQAIFHRNSLSLAFSFNFHNIFQVFDSRGGGGGGWRGPLRAYELIG
jgi:hypothetical protein